MLQQLSMLSITRSIHMSCTTKLANLYDLLLVESAFYGGRVNCPNKRGGGERDREKGTVPWELFLRFHVNFSQDILLFTRMAALYMYTRKRELWSITNHTKHGTTVPSYEETAHPPSHCFVLLYSHTIYLTARTIVEGHGHSHVR